MDRYIQILTALAEKGVEIQTDVSELLYRIFDRPLDVWDTPWNSVSHEILDFLVAMQKNEHISFIESKIAIDTETFKYDVNARLTFSGLEYLNQHQLTQSNLDLNNAIRQNFIFQKRATLATVCVAFLAALFSFLSYIKPEPKMAELNANIKSIAAKIERSRAQQEFLRNHLISGADSSHKH